MPREGCGGDYKVSEAILRAAGFDSTELTDIFNVLKSRGGCCDCEALYNVAETSRLKTEYWRDRAKGLEVQATHLPHSRPAQ